MKNLVLTTEITPDNLRYIEEFNKRISKAAAFSLKEHYSANELSLLRKCVAEASTDLALEPLHMQLAVGLVKADDLMCNEVKKIIKNSFLKMSLGRSTEFVDFEQKDLERLRVLDWTKVFFDSHLDENGKTYLKKGNEVSEKTKVNLQKTFSFLSEEWPEYAELSKRLCSYVVFVSSPRFQSGVALNTFGAIFANIMNKLQYPEVIEIFVHEVAHLHLLAHEQNTQFILNEELLVESPLRLDMRPLRGSFHSCYALVRMTEALYRYVKKNPKDNLAVGMFKNNLKRLEKGLLIVSENAKLSLEGKELVHSMQKKSKDLAKTSSF